MMTPRTIIAAILVALPAAAAAAPARADTTADCGRFYLKYDPATQTMKCVGVTRENRRESVSIGAIRRQQRTVQRILTQVQGILSLDELGAEQQRRVRELISDARQRVRQIRRQTAQLRQEQIAFSDEVQAAAQQRTRQQIELSRSLEQQQRELVRQLGARQRQLLQSQQRRARDLGR